MSGGAAEGFCSRAVHEGVALDAGWIERGELARARHALAYLKDLVGDAGMRKLVAAGVATTTGEVADWVRRSRGAWRSAEIELVLTGPVAAEFEHWYDAAMAHRREAVLRSGHPEHFVLAPGKDGIEVIENIGETPLPWRVFYRSLPDVDFPEPWAEGWPVRFGSELLDGEGLRVGYTMHHARDADDGMHMLLRTLLPEAAPADLAQRHLRHFAIEFTNWARIAWSEAREKEAAS